MQASREAKAASSKLIVSLFLLLLLFFLLLLLIRAPGFIFHSLSYQHCFCCCCCFLLAFNLTQMRARAHTHKSNNIIIIINNNSKKTTTNLCAHNLCSLPILLYLNIIHINNYLLNIVRSFVLWLEAKAHNNSISFLYIYNAIQQKQQQQQPNLHIILF